MFNIRAFFGCPTFWDCQRSQLGSTNVGLRAVGGYSSQRPPRQSSVPTWLRRWTIVGHHISSRTLWAGINTSEGTKRWSGQKTSSKNIVRTRSLIGKGVEDIYILHDSSFLDAIHQYSDNILRISFTTYVVLNQTHVFLKGSKRVLFSFHLTPKRPRNEGLSLLQRFGSSPSQLSCGRVPEPLQTIRPSTYQRGQHPSCCRDQ